VLDGTLRQPQQNGALSPEAAYLSHAHDGSTWPATRRVTRERAPRPSKLTGEHANNGLLSPPGRIKPRIFRPYFAEITSVSSEMTNTEWLGADVLSMDSVLITGIRTASLVFRCHVRGLITDSAVPGGLRLAGDFAEPEPAPDECVVEVRAFSLNYGETILLRHRPDG
jgi:hypothetical protein